MTTVLSSIIVPWHCPACHSIIHHQQEEERPRADERYRCHVCHITLMYDAGVEALRVTAIDANHVPPVNPRAVGTPRASKPRRG